MKMIYIIALNLSLVGFAYYHDKKVKSLQDEIESLKKPIREVKKESK